jgi:hypothetical protein
MQSPPAPEPPACPVGTAFIDGECKPIGRLLSALIKKCIYTDKGVKLDARMYLDLFGEKAPEIGVYINTKSPSGISIQTIYSDPEYQYHEYGGTGTFKLFGIKPDDINNGKMSNYLTTLSNIKSDVNKLSGSMKNIATYLNEKAGTKTDRLVAFFFDIAIVIYSLYYKKADNNDLERKNTSLRNVYYSALKSFMLPSFSSIVGKDDEAIINKFIKYYDAGTGAGDTGVKQTARLKSLRAMAGGKSKHRKNFKTQKSYSKKSKKYTRRK